MKEKFKTVILVVLIALSLYQSYLLAYSKPDFDPVSQDEYVEAEWIGEPKELEQLVFPTEMILHLSEGRHTVLYPGFQFYNLVYDKIRQRTFGGFREISTDFSTIEMRDRQLGLEIRFRQPVPIETLTKLMTIRPDNPDLPQTVRRIWITIEPESEQVRTFFSSAHESVWYEATQADLTVRDVQEMVGFGEFLPAYHPQRNGNYYLPNEPISAVKTKVAYNRYTPEQLQKSLFVDPASSRHLLERDGTEIYTDGKRGLQIYHGRHWMSFSDPVAPMDAYHDLRESLLASVKFVNRHGGWNGIYLWSGLEEDVVRQFLFRQYYRPYANQQALPILPTDALEFGYIRLGIQRGTVTHYERSLIELEDEVLEVSEATLPGGHELIQLLNEFERSNEIRAVFPAYAPRLNEQYVELVPKWAALLENGEEVFLH